MKRVLEQPLFHSATSSRASRNFAQLAASTISSVAGRAGCEISRPRHSTSFKRTRRVRFFSFRQLNKTIIRASDRRSDTRTFRKFDEILSARETRSNKKGERRREGLKRERDKEGERGEASWQRKRIKKPAVFSVVGKPQKTRDILGALTDRIIFAVSLTSSNNEVTRELSACLKPKLHHSLAQRRVSRIQKKKRKK